MDYLNHPAEYNRMMETAKKRASELRGEAIADFWLAAGDATRRALRAATRYASALARHNGVRNRSMEA